MPRPALLRPGATARRFLALILGALAATWPAGAEPDPGQTGPTLTLAECIDLALRQHRNRPASQFAVAAAEAQHRQVLAAYWPQVDLRASYERLDEAPNFLFPSLQVMVPAQTATIPASTAVVTVPAGILGPDPVPLPVSVPPQTAATQPATFAVPPQDIRLMDPSIGLAGVEAQWLVADGGMRRGLRAQAEAAVEAMKQAARRTDLEVVETVTRLYHGAVLARQLRSLGQETLERMGATLLLTERLYQEGDGEVTKTDFLANKIMVETLRAMVVTLEKNAELSGAALANSIGLSWRESVQPADQEIPLEWDVPAADALVDGAYQFSPDWLQLEAGLRAQEGAVRTARSGRAPRLALTGKLHRMWNDYDAGLMTPANQTRWSVGVGIELPLFDGFLTRHKVAAAQARLAELKEQRLLMREGLGLQIRAVLIEWAASARAHAATQAARTAAEENCDLNTRAYQSALVETEDVIQSQLVQALMTAQHLKTRYDQAAHRARLSLLVGHEFSRRLFPSP